MISTPRTASSAVGERVVGPAGHAVLERYDELAGLLVDSRDPSPAAWSAASDSTMAAVSQVICGEARLLDTGQFDRWLTAWTDDAVLWVPLPGSAHPATDQALFLDDRRRLGDRVRWRTDPSAWGQQPASITVRMVGSIEAWSSDAAPGSAVAVGEPERILVSSAVTIVEHRIGRVETLAGHQVHELVGPDLRRRTKIILLPMLSIGVRNPSFVL